MDLCKSALALILLAAVPADAADIYNCDGMTSMEACRWKLVCQKDPSQPNKIIPADCAQNYKEPEPPAPAAPAPEAPKEEVKKERSTLEQLYYVDGDDLREYEVAQERKKLQEELLKAQAANDKKKVPEKKVEKAPASQAPPVEIVLPQSWEEVP